MSHPSHADRADGDTAETGEDADALGTDDVFHLLQNQRRRRTLRYLRDHDDGDGVDMRDVVEWVAAEEHDTTVQALRSKERQRVYIALYQAHLPKLDKLGIVEYDKRRGWVELRERAAVVMPYLRVGEEGDGSVAPAAPAAPVASVDDTSVAVEAQSEGDSTADGRGTALAGFDRFEYVALGAAALLVALAAVAPGSLPDTGVELAVLGAFAAATLGNRLRADRSA